MTDENTSQNQGPVPHADVAASADGSSAPRPSWTDREDQLAAGFREVVCRGCGTHVLVRKMSITQTSTQWHSKPTCRFLARDEDGRPGERCPELIDSIWAAVEAGSLPTEPT